LIPLGFPPERYSLWQFRVLPGLAWSLSIGDGALAYLRRSESGNAYLTRFVALQYITRDLSTAAKIYLLFIGWRAYYYEWGWFHNSSDLQEFCCSFALRTIPNKSNFREDKSRLPTDDA
jgi:hypothetical protein